MKYAAILPLSLVMLAGCQQEKPAPVPQKISESDAEIIANRNEVEFASTDAARIEAVYAPDVVAFDAVSMPLITDRTRFDALQKEFAAQKFDSISDRERKIQVLDPDTFIVSGTSDLASTTVPGNRATMRYTQVYEKQQDGNWRIVNEHISTVK